MKSWSWEFGAGVKCQPMQRGCWKVTANSGVSCFKENAVGGPQGLQRNHSCLMYILLPYG